MFRVTACLCIVLFALPTLAVENTAAKSPSQLDAAWRTYLETSNDQTALQHFPHQNCFERSAAAYNLPLPLLLAVARGESAFNARAVSSANAIGVMQILWPGTANHLGINRRRDLFKPCLNIDAGARYLKELLSRYKGNLHRSLAAYNYGPGRITVQGSAMPKGAQWYSGYIYRHLHHVLSSNVDYRNTTTQAKASDQDNSEKKLNVITFRTPYRAKAFVDNLKRQQAQSPFADQLQWFRVGTQAFRVVLLYSSAGELKRAKQWLAEAGLGG